MALNRGRSYTPGASLPASCLKQVAIICCLMLLQLFPAAADETYPNRVIKLIVPFAAGGNGDSIARVTATYMQKALGANVVVENRPGAGGIIGTDAVAKSPPDGYTLCICSTGPVSVAPWTEKLTYDPQKDLLPISLISTNPLVLIVNPKLPANSATELVKLSKSTPSGLSYSNIGAAGLITYSAEIFKVETGANIVAVPYRGGALATAAVVNNEVQLSFANMSDAIGQLESKTVRPLAVTTATRSPFLPDVPTLIEEKLVKYPIESWNAMIAPAGVPKPIVDRLAKLMEQMSKDPEVKRMVAQFGSTAASNSPEEFARQIRDETRQWGEGLEAIGLKRK